jgi:uncharacterized protein YecT (DUF1311 family)
MPMDHGCDPWSDGAYKGFAGGPAGEAGAEPATPRPRGRPNGLLVAAGVTAALLVGVALGFLVRPALIGRAPPGAHGAPAASALTPPRPTHIPIAVAPPPPAQAEAAPTPRGKLQTLPPEMAAAERGPARADAASEAGATAAAAAPAPQAYASIDCAAAAPGAEQLVCSDPQLAAQDRRLARAWRRALASGADPVALSQAQQDWTAIREDAARRSREAVAQVYDQRIAELDRIAGAVGAASDDGDRDDGQ